MIGYFQESAIPRWLRRLGCFEVPTRGIRSGSLRFRWGLEVSRGWGIGAELCLFDDPPSYSLHVLPLYGNIFLRLPLRAHREPAEMMASWGFSWRWFDLDGSTIHLHWGAGTKIFEMPWRYRHHMTEILLHDGSWRPQVSITMEAINSRIPYDSYDKPLPDVHVEEHPYHYMLDDGTVQHVTAKVTVERSTRRRPWWLFNWGRTRRSIAVAFSEGVGDGAGSWKGGTTGCWYEQRPGERPRDTLRRMQRERRFAR